ncbi:DUF2326 domain-containing protein [Pseudoalteromonas carrageenovora]|uniref:DUF2326 domain-containing protein n=1 Tax=Pseudoalteromonas TaxID=53246 RepID=UPI00160081F2|nr:MULTISPECIES: DUF2326 domain-containing protein [Pseudoalteromonas]MBB1450065.1 DUF2326 domain-containing protein [Pseudoalteromonas sp. SG43-1]MCQ8888250.1 DUF2326 domain-containing protein [Pseudoalteromonas carrageenovora]
MLKSISCEKLIKSPITFEAGLNAVVGADDAHNSIGKSSILMLIDFVFGGNDFPSKCDDVVRNVGNFKVGIEFEFDKTYSFIRDTENIDQIYRLESQDYITSKEYNAFLKDKYLPKNELASFRECVSGFFRIYQRNNYNDKRPLDIVSKENWDAIRKRTLKIFGKYDVIASLEKDKVIATKLKNDINGTFNSGAIKKVSKVQAKKNELELVGVSAEIEAIKASLKVNVTDIKSIINEINLSLKKEKDRLVDLQQELNTKLIRIDSHLSGNIVRNSKSFNSVVEFFPEIDQDKLQKVENFHSGITKILKNQLQEEKLLVLNRIELSKIDVKKIDDELLEIVDSKEESVYLLERLMELDRYEHNLKLQNEFFTKSDDAKTRLSDLKEDIDNALVDSIDDMELLINDGMNSFIEKIYNDNPISPKISFQKNDYIFDHGDDRGTGKGFADMICFDLTFLEKTILPCLIHDSLLFKNMDVPAVEKLISIYSRFKKQIFIAIDEKSKYSNETQNKINDAMFLELNENKVAFKVKWKKTTQKGT